MFPRQLVVVVWVLFLLKNKLDNLFIDNSAFVIISALLFQKCLWIKITKVLLSQMAAAMIDTIGNIKIDFQALQNLMGLSSFTCFVWPLPLSNFSWPCLHVVSYWFIQYWPGPYGKPYLHISRPKLYSALCLLLNKKIPGVPILHVPYSVSFLVPYPQGLNPVSSQSS